MKHFSMSVKDRMALPLINVIFRFFASSLQREHLWEEACELQNTGIEGRWFTLTSLQNLDISCSFKKVQEKKEKRDSKIDVAIGGKE